MKKYIMEIFNCETGEVVAHHESNNLKYLVHKEHDIRFPKYLPIGASKYASHFLYATRYIKVEEQKEMEFENVRKMAFGY